MGILKLTLICLLLLSVSVNGQEDPIVNEDEIIVSENTIDDAQNVVEEVPADAVDKEPPVEILKQNETLLVRSGQYQLLDNALTGGEPIDTLAVNFGDGDGTLNQRQLMQPPTTSPTGVYNEYGERNYTALVTLRCYIFLALLFIRVFFIQL